MNQLVQSKMSPSSFAKLERLSNPKLNAFIKEYAELCEPQTIYICDDSDTDAEYIRRKSLEMGEEKKLSKKNQTIHYDGANDQGRDKENTLLLVKKEDLAAMGNLNSRERTEGLE